MDLPRLIVEVQWGKLAGRKAVIEPGKRLRVGRSELSDMAIGHDGQMSAVHFELSWDGAKCSLRDAGSIKGTLLDGEPVKEAEVGHAGWIRAGVTDFKVHVEGHTPARLDQEDDGDDEDREGEESWEAEARERAREEERRRLEAAEKALGVLKAEGEKAPLYAVLDAARDDRILELLRESVETYRSLYEGTEGEALGDVAPYLVRLPVGSRLLEALVREGWGKRWGVYVLSEPSLVALRKHLRKLLVVDLNSAITRRAYFRFYDPRVLNEFLVCATAIQRSLLEDGVRFVAERIGKEV